MRYWVVLSLFTLSWPALSYTPKTLPRPDVPKFTPKIVHTQPDTQQDKKLIQQFLWTKIRLKTNKTEDGEPLFFQADKGGCIIRWQLHKKCR